MSLQLPFGVRVLNPYPIEDKYLNNGIPYTATTQVNSLLASGIRHIGLTVNINNVEYWYATGTSNSSLVVKSPSVVAGGGVTGGTNGLTKTGANLKLGGVLTGATTIGLGANNLILTGTTGTLRYGSDLSAQYNVRSLVDKGYVTGLTSQAISGANNGLTKSGTNVHLGGLLTGDTTIAGNAKKIFLGSSFSNDLDQLNISTAGSSDWDLGTDTFIHTTDYNNTIYVSQTSGIEMTAIAGSNKIYFNNAGLSYNAPSGKGVSLGVSGVATLSIASGAGNFKITDSRSGTGQTGIVYNGDYSANYTNRSLVDKAYVTGLTTTSGVQTASNGLTKVSTDVKLGGSLAANTTIATSVYDFAISGTSGDISLTNDGNQLMIDAAGIAVTLNGSDTLRYSADYSGNYVARSLVDKAYVDSTAAGLDPKASVHFATVAPLTGATYNPTGGVAGSGSFSNADTVIDGHALVNGDRILVKNQADPKQNGIYEVISATGGTWQRASDQDGTPSNEVSSGNFTFVQTGATQISTGWVLGGNGVLTLNTDPLIWIQFSAANSYLGGNGINISGNTIYVDLASNSGLDFSGGGLRVNPSIAGDGLTFTTGVLNVGASNGLTANGNDLHLGGVLTGDTVIDGNSNTYNLTLDNMNKFIVNTAGAGSEISLTSTNLTATPSSFNATISGNITLDTGGPSVMTLNSANLKADAAQFNVNVSGMGGVGLVSDNSVGLNSQAGPLNISGGTVKIGSSNGSFAGAQYNADYSANYTNRSLVDKAYVIGITSTGITLANNGLTKSGQRVHLGGALTGATQIGLGANSITFTGTTGTLKYGSDLSANYTVRSLVDKGYVTGVTSIIGLASNGLTKVGNYITLGGALTGNTSVVSNGEATAKSMYFGGDPQGQRLNQFSVYSTGSTGSQYFEQYDGTKRLSQTIFGSGGFINIDATDDSNSNDTSIFINTTYATIGHTDGGTNDASTLTTSNAAVQVQVVNGASTKNNQINVDLTKIESKYHEDSVAESVVNLNGTHALLSYQNLSTVEGTQLFIQDGSLTISSDNAVFPGAQYDIDYSANYTNRSLVDKGYVTSVTTGNLNVQLISANTTLTGNTLILVTTTGSSITVTLPSSPANGKVFKIKDRSGNAGTNTITISGNGKNIDGSSTSTINTNYGGTEMVFSSSANAWFITGFVN